VDALTRVVGQLQNAGERLEADERAGALLALAAEESKSPSRALLPATV